MRGWVMGWVGTSALSEIIVHHETREILHVRFYDPHGAKEMLKRIEEREPSTH